LQSSEKLLGFLKFTCVSSVTALCLFLNQFVHNFVLEYHQKTGKQLKNYDNCRLRLSIILSDLGLKLVAQVGSTETSCFDLAILLFTQSRAQGTVDNILARWRLDLSAAVEESGGYFALPCSVPCPVERGAGLAAVTAILDGCLLRTEQTACSDGPALHWHMGQA
jgi:hypothetical protein